MCNPALAVYALMAASTAYSVSQSRKAAQAQKEAQDAVMKQQKEAADAAKKAAATPAPTMMTPAQDAPLAPTKANEGDMFNLGRGRFAFQLFDDGKALANGGFNEKVPTLGAPTA